MSQPQVARPHAPTRPCPPPHFPPPHLPSTCVENGSTVSGSQRTFISPHLCGLRRDDLGLQPSQPSCHLRRRRKKDTGGGGRRRQGGERKEKEGKGGGEESCLIRLLRFRSSKQLFDMFLLGTKPHCVFFYNIFDTFFFNYLLYSMFLTHLLYFVHL